MPASKTQTLAERVLTFFNTVNDPYEIRFRIVDDPAYGSPKGRGISLTTAQAILDARDKYPKKKFVTIVQIDEVIGVGDDTMHDILYSFYEPNHPLPGTVSAFAMETPPDGWLECDGQAINRTVYANLFSAIGTSFGSGDADTTFNVPDLRGEFVRGWDHGRTVDPYRAFGTNQLDQLQSHKHKEKAPGHRHRYQDIYWSEWYGWVYIPFQYGSGWGMDTDNKGIEMGRSTYLTRINISNPTNSGAGEPRYGMETRPVNIALMYCIKY